MANLPPELVREVEASGGRPISLRDPATRRVYFLIDEALFAQIKALLPDLDVEAAYAAADEVFAPDWNDLLMAEYDDYESRRP